MSLPKELELIHKEVYKYVEKFGLDPFPVIFELCDYDQMQEIAAYGGFPTRYPHWRFGMSYDHLSKGNVYGLQKIYELVINHNPCYAFLLTSNELVDQKLVMAHVYAHSDFFKNNLFFKNTNRKMLDGMANHSGKIRGLTDKYGMDVVEAFIDTCLSIENLIDPYVLTPKYVDAKKTEVKGEKKYLSRQSISGYLNPHDNFSTEVKRSSREEVMEIVPKERDVLLFLLENAPLDDWQTDILAIVREEAYYFAPQAMTKIMNEGWASYWHSKIMTEKALRNQEFLDYATHHAATVAVLPGQINPYKLGIELFRDIADRWDRGCFGPEYDACGSYSERARWNKVAGEGTNKIFEVRRIYNDVSFIDTFLTEDFCFKHHYFTYAYNRRTGRYEIVDRDWKKVKEKMLFGLTNLGNPIVFAADNNFEGKGELLLIHEHIGVDLKIDEAKDTLAAIYAVWKKPVNLATELAGQKKLLSYNGEEHRERNL